MSDELISRSALKKDLEVTPYNDIDDLVRTERLIDNASAVDAYPFEQVQELVKLNQQFAQEIENLKRPKGKWIEGEVESYLLGIVPYHRYTCSECGYHFSNKRGAKNPCYCQDCGADMRGDEE